MNSQDTARQVVGVYLSKTQAVIPASHALVSAVQAAIDAAVDAEREACAQLCDAMASGIYGAAQAHAHASRECAAMIRVRGER